MPTENYRLRIATEGANRAKAQLLGIRNVGQQLALVFGGLALGRAFIGSIKLMEEFEATMARVRAVSGATDNEFRALSETARTLGATTVFSARQAAEGMVFLSQAGFTSSETMQAVADSLKLAQAGALELATAADITAKSIRIFNLQASESGRLADVLSKAAASSNTSVEQLGHALSFVGPVAKTLNISLEETVALVGVVSDRGVQAGRAGTGLRQVLLSLITPTSEAAEKMRGLGINVEDVANRVKAGDITGVLGVLDAVFQDAGLAAEVFGRRAIAAGLAVGQNQDAYSDLVAKLRDAEGAATDMARTMNNTLRGAFLSLRSATEEYGLQLGDAGLLSAFTNLAKVLAGVLSIQNDMFDVFKENTEISKTMETVIIVLSKAFDILKGLLTVLIARFLLLRARVVAYTISAKVAALATGTLATRMAFLRSVLNSLVLVIAAVAFSQMSKDVAIVTGRIDEMGEAVKIQISRWREWYLVIRATLAGIVSIFDFNPRTSFQKTFNETLSKSFEELEDRFRVLKDVAQDGVGLDAIDKSAKSTSSSVKQITEDIRDLAQEFVLLDQKLAPVSDALLSGNLSVKDAEVLLDAYKEFVPTFNSFESALDNLTNTINTQDQSLEDLQFSLGLLESEYFNILKRADELIKKAMEYDDALNSGEITQRQFRRNTRALADEYQNLTRQVERVAQEYEETTRAIERESEKQKEAIQGVLDVANSLISSLDNINNRFNKKTQIQDKANALENDLQQLQSLRATEAGRGSPDRAAIAEYDTEILRVVRELQGLQSQLNTEYSTQSLLLQGSGDLLRTIEPLVKAFAGAGAFQTGGIVPGRGAVPIIAHGGEAIFNPKQLNNLNSLLSSNGRNTGSFNLSIINQSSQPIVANESNSRQTENGFNIELMVRNVVANQISSGAFDSQLSTRFDLSRRLA